MNANYTALFTDFETEHETIKGTITDNLELCLKMIHVIEKKLKEIHKGLKKHRFENVQEEIYFFKELKPKLVSKLIYYKSIYKLEAALPPIKKNKIKLYEKELRKIQQYAFNNKEFYEYYRSRSCYKDEEYFVRYSYKDIIRNDCFLINYDSKLCTSHDYNVAIFIAYDMLASYIENRLDELNSKRKKESPSNSNLNWTGSKVDLVELMYALQQSGAINKGNCDIKELAINFGRLLNIDIEDNVYRAYLDIKSRKPVQTKFLVTLTENLNKKIKEEDR